VLGVITKATWVYATWESCARN